LEQTIKYVCGSITRNRLYTFVVQELGTY